MSVTHSALHQIGPEPTISIVTAPDGAPEVQVQPLDVTGPPTDILAGPIGSRVVDSELTPLTGGWDVLTWVDAYSHGLQANYAILDPHDAVVSEATYGQGYSTSFEAVALPKGGFALIDGETNLFGQQASMTLQTFDAAGAPVGGAKIVESGSSPSGFQYVGVEAATSPAGIEITWSDPTGEHSAFVKSNGTVVASAPGDFADGHGGHLGPLDPEMFGLPGPSHAAGWFV